MGADTIVPKLYIKWYEIWNRRYSGRDEEQIFEHVDKRGRQRRRYCRDTRPEPVKRSWARLVTSIDFPKSNPALAIAHDLIFSFTIYQTF